MAFSPVFKSPLTDAFTFAAPTGRVHPFNPFCTNITMKYTDCIEAYGVHKGKLKCAELYYDMMECARGFIQVKRAKEIQNERLKQYKEGKLDQKYAEYPPLDAFMNIK